MNNTPITTHFSCASIPSSLATINISKQIPILYERLRKTVAETLQAMQQFALFPLRYFGSKSFTIVDVLRSPIHTITKGIPKGSFGYSFNPSKVTSQDESRIYLPYSIACAQALKETDQSGLTKAVLDQINAKIDLSNLKRLFPSLVIQGNKIIDNSTGLQMSIFEEKSEIIIAFADIAAEGNA